MLDMTYFQPNWKHKFLEKNKVNRPGFYGDSFS